jgi:dienelactone hydrolase
VFAVYGELDERITSKLPVIEEAMSEHGKDFDKTVYPGAQHAFHNRFLTLSSEPLLETMGMAILEDGGDRDGGLHHGQPAARSRPLPGTYSRRPRNRPTGNAAPG